MIDLLITKEYSSFNAVLRFRDPEAEEQGGI